jgi:peptidyl-prolyl cis-trans isomerase A (cyclophilin A)
MKKLIVLIAITALVSCGNPYKKLMKDLDIKEGMLAEMVTNKGTIVFSLEFEKAPITVANFVGLAEGTIENSFRELGKPYFDGLNFHRVVPNFVVQGGDPLGSGMGNPGYRFKTETHDDLKHDKAGTVAMANSGPNTNGSQFYITHTPTPHLDGGYNVFGYVLEGMEVVNELEMGDIIESVTIYRKGSAAKNFDAAATMEKL